MNFTLLTHNEFPQILLRQVIRKAVFINMKVYWRSKDLRKPPRDTHLDGDHVVGNHCFTVSLLSLIPPNTLRASSTPLLFIYFPLRNNQEAHIAEKEVSSTHLHTHSHWNTQKRWTGKNIHTSADELKEHTLTHRYTFTLIVHSVTSSRRLLTRLPHASSIFQNNHKTSHFPGAERGHSSHLLDAFLFAAVFFSFLSRAHVTHRRLPHRSALLSVVYRWCCRCSFCVYSVLVALFSCTPVAPVNVLSLLLLFFLFLLDAVSAHHPVY